MCLECPLTRTVHAQIWSQTVLMERDHLITELRSGRDRRPLSLCSKAAWFGARNSMDKGVAAALPSSSLLVVRVGNTELDCYP